MSMAIHGPAATGWTTAERAGSKRVTRVRLSIVVVMFLVSPERKGLLLIIFFEDYRKKEQEKLENERVGEKGRMGGDGG